MSIKIQKILSYIFTFILVGFLSTSSVNAATNTLFTNLPEPIPGNVPSLGVEAYSMPEIGSQLQLVGSDRNNPTISVLMSSWGCESGAWHTQNCTTSDGATFTHPITLNIYGVKPDNTPDTLIKTISQTFTIPYRPSKSDACTDGKWSDGTSCFNGKAFSIDFDLSGTNLPEKVIVSVAYNTSHNGYSPMGEQACFTEDGGCGYDSLNVGLAGTPTIGSVLPSASDIYQNTSYGPNYCDSGVSGTGTFRLDSGCWAGYLPVFKVTTTSDTTAPSTPVMTGFTNPTLSCGGITNSHASTVNWTTSTDESGIAGYEYYVDYPLVGGGRGIWNPANLWTNTYNAGSLNEGVHHIKVRAKDNAGNYSEWSNICDITADWTSPVLSFTGFRDQSSSTYDNTPTIKSCGSVNNSGFISWEWALSSTEVNPISYLYEILSGPTAVGYSATTTATHYNGQIPMYGLYAVRVTGQDIAGNVSAPITCSVDYKQSVVLVPPPTKESDCKKNGWKIYNNPTFKNQGQCEKYVEQHKHDRDDHKNDRDDRGDKSDKDKKADGKKKESELSKILSLFNFHRD